MKTLKIVKAVMAALPLVSAFVVHAETEKIGNYTWQYSVVDGKAWIGSGVAETAAIAPTPVGEVTVPSELGGYEVWRLDDRALFGCDEMTKLIIPDCVHQMGDSAVRGCSALREVSLPENLEYVAGNSFRDCPALEEVVLPPNVERIDSYAFEWCTSLTNFVFNNGLRRIGENIFVGCEGLTTLEIPVSVTNIAQKMLLGCGNLESLTLPFIGSQRGNHNTTDSVFGWLFAQTQSSAPGCMKIVQYYDDGLYRTTYIPPSLKRVVITDETVVGKGAFQNCSNLTSVVIGNSVTNIAKGAFAGCGGLESMTLPFIGSERGNTGTPDSLFGHIFGSVSYNGGEANDQYYSTESFMKYYIPRALTEVVITDETVLGYAAFCHCSRLTSVTLPNSLTSILDGGAFWMCRGFSSLTIPNSVTNIGSDAFHYCSSLETVFVPLNVISIGDYSMFESCSSLHLAYIPRRFKGRLPESTFQNCAADLQIIYYDENMRFFDETLRTADNSSTNIVAVCTNDCRVTFKWKCSCEPMFKGNLYDYLSFSIDGVQQSFICGETDWTNQSYTVSGAGEHTFTWTYQKDAQDAAGEDCGWVKQVVVAPLVTLSFDGGEAESGTAPADMSFYADDDTAVLPGCGTLALSKHSFAGWSDGESVYAAGSACPYLKAAQTLTAVWAANTLSAPVITAPATYEADSATVTITADEGTSIYYTIDGSVPSADGAGSCPYLGPFEVEGSATVRAIAVRDNYFDSEVSQFEVTRLTWTFGEYMNCPGRTFTTGGDAEWVRAKGVSADGYALRSGTITHSQTSRLETVVYGAGTVSFRCKVDGEIIKKIVYDGLAFCIDGIQQGDLMGDAEWTEKTFTVTGDGRHVLGWLYVKDEDGSGGGEDCAWLDCVTWTPTDPLPALDAQAADGDAAAIVGGLLDVRLSEKIVGTAAYGAFRNWVDGKGLSHVAVRDAPNAWFSYALDAPGLMAKAAPLASEDVVIESIEPSRVTSGAFDLVVDIAGVEIGMAANLAEVFGVEGATELNESAFSSEGISFTLQRTADGKIKAMVAPVGSPPSFFLRVKVK